MAKLHTLFDREVPPNIASDGPPLMLGAPFRVYAPCRFAGWSYYGQSYRGGAWRDAQAIVDHWGLLRNDADATVLFLPFERTRGVDPEGDDDWRDFWIHPRVKLLEDTQYTFLVWFEYSRYGYFPGRFDSTWTNGPLEVYRPSEGSPAGRYNYGTNLTDTLSTSTAAYAVDILIETDF